MNKTEAQTLARQLAADLTAALSSEDETATVLEAQTGEAWVVGVFAEGDTWEQNDTSDFVVQESRNKPGVWCVVEYDEGTPAFCYPSPDLCFPLVD